MLPLQRGRYWPDRRQHRPGVIPSRRQLDRAAGERHARRLCAPLLVRAVRCGSRDARQQARQRIHSAAPDGRQLRFGTLARPFHEPEQQLMLPAQSARRLAAFTAPRACGTAAPGPMPPFQTQPRTRRHNRHQTQQPRRQRRRICGSTGHASRRTPTPRGAQPPRGVQGRACRRRRRPRRGADAPSQPTCCRRPAAGSGESHR